MGGVVLGVSWAYEGVTRAVKKLCDLWFTRHDPKTPVPNAAPQVASYRLIIYPAAGPGSHPMSIRCPGTGRRPGGR